MKMPGDIELDRFGVTKGTVRFRTKCGAVSGAAFLKTGEFETHYDVVNVRKLTPLSIQGQSISPRIVQTAEVTGSFEISGRVTFLFDDGVFTVEAHGFDFWVEPTEIDGPVQVGDWIQLGVRNLTLYV